MDKLEIIKLSLKSAGFPVSNICIVEDKLKGRVYKFCLQIKYFLH